VTDVTFTLEMFYISVIVINGLAALFTMWYYHRRISLEERRAVALETQSGELKVYYDKRLSVEKAKLEVERKKLDVRKNGNGDKP